MPTKSLNKLWCVFCADTKQSALGLTTREVQAVCKVFGKDRQRLLFVWAPGFDSWRPLHEFKHLLEFAGIEIPGIVPPIPGKQEVTVTTEDENLSPLVERSKADELGLESIQVGMLRDVRDLLIISDDEKNSRRQFKRYKKRFNIELIRDQEKFKTFSVNISVGGILLKDSLPASFHGYFTVKIKDPKTNEALIHTCWAIDDQSKDRRQIAFLPFKKQESQEQFEKWIQAA